MSAVWIKQSKDVIIIVSYQAMIYLFFIFFIYFSYFVFYVFCFIDLINLEINDFSH